jgi:signal transduction histidine kinase
VPIIRRDGSCFGTLCALDTEPKNLDESLLDNFRLFAELISFELEAEERELQRESELAEAAKIGELREKLMGILGHDLRNPLHTIKVSTEILSNNEANGAMEAKLIEKIANNTKRMERLISDLLDLTRSRLGEGIPVKRKPIDLKRIFSQTIDDFSVSHSEHTIVFESEGNFFGNWDSDRIAQVISNLLGNALVYGAKDKPIHIKLRDEIEKIFFSIHNHGKPISPQQIENLFNPYRRAIIRESSDLSNGLGLGLYIVQQIVKAHKGTIEVHSNALDGTTFSISLPRT